MTGLLKGCMSVLLPDEKFDPAQQLLHVSDWHYLQTDIITSIKTTCIPRIQIWTIFSNMVSFQPWGHKIHFSDVSSVIKNVLIYNNNNNNNELIECFWKLKVLHNLKKNIQCANTHNYTNQWNTSVQNMKINKHLHTKHGTNTCTQDRTRAQTHTNMGHSPENWTKEGATFLMQ